MHGNLPQSSTSRTLSQNTHTRQQKFSNFRRFTSQWLRVMRVKNKVAHIASARMLAAMARFKMA